MLKLYVLFPGLNLRRDFQESVEKSCEEGKPNRGWKSHWSRPPNRCFRPGIKFFPLEWRARHGRAQGEGNRKEDKREARLLLVPSASEQPFDFLEAPCVTTKWLFFPAGNLSSECARRRSWNAVSNRFRVASAPRRPRSFCRFRAGTIFIKSCKAAEVMPEVAAVGGASGN